jgi:hypothetical protein
MNSIDEILREGVLNAQGDVGPFDEDRILAASLHLAGQRLVAHRHHRRVTALVVGLVVLLGSMATGITFSLHQSPPTHAEQGGRAGLRDPEAGAGGFTVDPSTDLDNGQSVSISIHGLRPNEQLLVLMCRGRPITFNEAKGACDLLTAMPVTTDAGGDAAVAYKVHRIVSDGHFGEVDCATYAGGCSIGVGDTFDLQNGGTTGNVEPVTFTQGPLNPSTVTSIATTPGAPFSDGERIELVGRGFPSNARVNIAQCPFNAECSPLYQTAQATSDGTFSVALILHRSLVVSGQTFSCSGLNSCYLKAQTVTGTSPPVVARPLPLFVGGSTP